MNGTAEKEVTPDLIYLNIVITEKDSKDKNSINSQEKAMIAKLKDLGIDTQKKLLIEDLDSDFQQRFLRKNDI